MHASVPPLRWAFLLIVGVMGARLGTEFLPKLEEGNLWIRAVMPPTITLEAGMDTVARIRNVIRTYPPVQTVFSEQGRGEDGTDPDGSFLAEFFVPLKPFESVAQRAKQGDDGQAADANSSTGSSSASTSTSRNTFRTTSRKPSRA